MAEDQLTEGDQASATTRPGVPSWAWAVMGGGVGLIAFVVRLVPVLTGGGLRGFYNYDPAVYYAAAVGMAHGLMPYRDFLLLHPPGIPIILLPFAGLGLFTTDAIGMAAARLAMMALGSLTAVIITRILRPVGFIPALIAGLAYAVYWPAVYSERSTWLEGPGSFLLAVALWLLLAPPTFLAVRPRVAASLAGAALGFACLTKMWLAVPLVVVFAWIAVRRKWRDLGWFTLGGAGIGALALVPFVTAFPTMLTMVVATQFGRKRGAGDTTFMRLEGLSGLNAVWHGHASVGALIVVAVAAAFALLAAFSRTGRLPLLVTVAALALLLTTPTWFRHYPELVAAPLMICLGEGVGVALSWVRQRWLRVTIGSVLAAALIAHGLALSTEHVGTRFNGAQLAQVARSHPGCVTTDDPNALIAADLLKQNLAQHCPYVIDLSGYRYYLGDRSSFVTNQAWQRFAADYLRAGSLNIMLRGTSKARLSPAFLDELRSWPVVATVSKRAVRAQP